MNKPLFILTTAQIGALTMSTNIATTGSAYIDQDTERYLTDLYVDAMADEIVTTHDRFRPDQTHAGREQYVWVMRHRAGMERTSARTTGWEALRHQRSADMFDAEADRYDVTAWNR